MRTKDRWTKSKTAVFNIGYHIIWCPKYRRPVLSEPIQQRLKQLIKHKTDELDCTIEALETMPDHVHLFVKTTPVTGVHFLIRQIKGYTAKVLRSEFPELKRKLPTLWTRSYYVESVGHISESTIRRYIEEQKGK